MDDLSDEQLALDIQQGRKEGLAVLVERHYDRIMAYLYRLCGGQVQLAQDMTQETFLRVLSRISLYQHSRPFLPWLYAIATNLARQHQQRAETRQADNLEEAQAEALATYDPSPEEYALLNDESRAVVDALARLPGHQREVVLLFYYQELSQQQIAESLGIPLGTVKSRLSLGLRRLRELLREVL